MIHATARRKRDGRLYVADSSPVMPDPVAVCCNAARALGGVPEDYEFIILRPEQLALYQGGKPVHLAADQVDWSLLPKPKQARIVVRRKTMFSNLSFEFLKSKRYIAAVSYVLSLVVVAYLPEFEGMEPEIASGLTVVFGLVIFGYSAENVIKALVIARALAAKTATPIDDIAVQGVAAGLGVQLPPAVEVNVGSAAH